MFAAKPSMLRIPVRWLTPWRRRLFSTPHTPHPARIDRLRARSRRHLLPPRRVATSPSNSGGQGHGHRSASRGQPVGTRACPLSRALRCKYARAIPEAQFARDNAVHTPHQPVRPTRTACRQPDISTCMPCVAVSTRERPAPVRAAGPRVAGARAPPRINV